MHSLLGPVMHSVPSLIDRICAAMSNELRGGLPARSWSLLRRLLPELQQAAGQGVGRRLPPGQGFRSGALLTTFTVLWGHHACLSDRPLANADGPRLCTPSAASLESRTCRAVQFGAPLPSLTQRCSACTGHPAGGLPTHDSCEPPDDHCPEVSAANTKQSGNLAKDVVGDAEVVLPLLNGRIVAGHIACCLLWTSHQHSPQWQSTNSMISVAAHGGHAGGS